MKRSRSVIGFLFVALLSAAVPPASGQTEPDWGSLPYFRHDYGGWMRIWTNENTFDKGVRVINASSSAFGNPNPGSTPEEPNTEFQVLWADKCQAKKAQTFKTSREFYVMGTPDKFQVSLGAYSSSTGNKPSPITSVELVINGTTVHEVKAAKGAPIPYETAQRAAIDITDAPLDYGLNTVTVIAQKKKTKKSLGWCTGDNKFGVLAEVYGEFLADMMATHTPAGASDTAYAFNVTVTNLGPSDLIPYSQYGDRFGVSVVSGLATVSSLEIFGEGCSEAVPISQGSKQGLASSCPLPRMARGESFTVLVGIEWSNFPPEATSDITYSALGYAEVDAAEQSNNGTTFGVKPGGGG